MKRYTKEQFEQLKPFERNFETAIKGDWARLMSRADVDKIYDIFIATTGCDMPRPRACGACVLELLKVAGHIYFEQKVSMTESPKKKAKRVTLKTSKK